MPDAPPFNNDPLTAVLVPNVRKVQLELLTKVDEICKSNNIHYVLFAGTLLGAVRHKGFIPWDDDVDLAMPREHYENFLNICKEELGEGYFLQTTDTDPEYFNLFARLRKNGTLYVQGQYQHFMMHHGIFIDIFPLDAASSSNLLGRIHRLLIRTSRVTFRALNFASNRQFIANLPNGRKKLALIVAHTLRLYFAKRSIEHLYKWSIQMLSHKHAEFLTHLTNDISKSRYFRYRISREEALKTTEVEFENLTFPAPQKHHTWLSRIYGNYLELPPRNQRKPHHNVIKVQT